MFTILTLLWQRTKQRCDQLKTIDKCFTVITNHSIKYALTSEKTYLPNSKSSSSVRTKNELNTVFNRSNNILLLWKSLFPPVPLYFMRFTMLSWVYISQLRVSFSELKCKRELVRQKHISERKMSELWDEKLLLFLFRVETGFRILPHRSEINEDTDSDNHLFQCMSSHLLSPLLLQNKESYTTNTTVLYTFLTNVITITAISHNSNQFIIDENKFCLTETNHIMKHRKVLNSEDFTKAIPVVRAIFQSA